MSEEMQPVAKWLTQEWFDLHLELAETQLYVPGVTVTVQTVITDAPDGDIAYYWIADKGKLVDTRLGSLDQPDVTFITSYESAYLMQIGDLDANTAFTRGKIRAEGDQVKIEELLPGAASQEFKDFGAAVFAKTEF